MGSADLAASFAKTVDTLVLARLADPDPYHSKTLTKLACDLLGWTDFKGGMELAFKAAGYRTHAAGYEGMDVDAYRAERLKAFVGMLNHFGLVKPPVA